MKIRFPLIMFFIILFSHDSFTQVTEEWSNVFRGPGTNHDQISENVLDKDNNVYVLGSSVDDNFRSDIYLFKYSSSGKKLWHRIFSSPLNTSLDIGADMVVDTLNNIYIVGRGNRAGTSSDIPIIKYDSSGNLIWNIWYHYKYDVGTSICLDNRGNLLISGYSNNDTIQGCYGVALKFDTSGSIIWNNRFYMPDHDELSHAKIAVDSLDNVYFVSPNNSFTSTINTQLIKYDSSGSLMWNYVYDNGYNEPFDMEVSKSGNLYICGYKSINNDIKILLLKFDNDGNFKWEESISNADTSTLEVGWDIYIDKFENVYFTGEVFGQQGNLDMIIGKYNSSGQQIWNRTHNGSGNRNDGGTSVLTDDIGNVYVTGWSAELVGRRNIITSKYSESGNLLWSKLYTRGIEDAGISIAIDTGKNIYTSGGSYGSNTGLDYDFTTIKYSQTTQIQQLSSSSPKAFFLSQSYPNPFNPATKIRFDIPFKSRFVKLAVYNSLGQLVESLVDEELSAGSYEYTFDGSDLSSGVYFYSIQTDGFTDTKKMLLVK